MALAPTTYPADRTPISFPQWKDALAASGLPPSVQAAHFRAILSFLLHCKRARAPATIAIARRFLAEDPTRPGETVRAALRWFFRSAQVAVDSPESVARVPPSFESHSTPPRAREDLGGADWERDLIRAIRQKGFLWRTEQTYRAWALRFAQHLRPKSPYVATGEDIAAFLTKLAVEQRVGAATQKQALNALVFFLQEGLHRSAGDFEFHRARVRPRVPTVLTRAECQRLFARLDGTPRLMAELMYGAGLRLLELLRLRIHHVDLERGQLVIHGGKGDKDRVTVLPEVLRSRLLDHIARLRSQFAGDRADAVPGVWLPETLARKYQRAGERWEWQWLFPSRELAIDPATGVKRRHQVLDGTFQNAIRLAAAAAGIDKRVTPHVLRHCVLWTPLRYAPGPALDANRGLTISALARSVLRHASARGWRRHPDRPGTARA